MFYLRLVVACAFALVAHAVSAQTFSIVDVGDFGGAHPNYPASKAVDGNTAFSSRWAANNGGSASNLFVDFGTVRRVDDIGVAWGRGNTRTHRFEVRARSGTSGSWTRIFSGTSSGTTTGIEQYNVNDIDARQVRVKVFSNSAGTDWTNITEFEVYGTSGPSGNPPPPPPPPPTDPDRVDVPAKIQAEDFTDYVDSNSTNSGGQYRPNEGVDIQNTGDAGGGFNVGWTNAGEWLEYDIRVNNSGAFSADMRLASTKSNSKYSISIDGSKVTSNQTVNNTGNWQNYYTDSVGIGNLSAGNHTLRVNVEASGFNLNWLELKTGTVNPPSPPPSGDFGLDPGDEPWENFDLSKWALDTPAPRPNDSCKAERTEEDAWDDQNPLSNASRPFFFTHTDGGMRFVTRVDGQTTSDSCNSGFVRSELREMLRAGDTSIDDTGVTKNNWALGYQPGNRNNWGGYNGRLNATLRVNKVTTSGSSSQVGRVIIGQIHADDDEPLRLYYRRRAGQSKGCIYFAHEIRGDDDVDFFMIGNESCTSGPSNGIELGELFSYSITNSGADISVVIRRGDFNGPVIATESINMNTLNSGYDRSDEWMYFKAGAYTQNNSGNDSDGDIVTFYRLSATHDGN